MAVKIDLGKCTGCYQCLIACPNALFTMVNGKASVDNKGCINCGVCKQSCYPGAITIIQGKALGGGY